MAARMRRGAFGLLTPGGELPPQHSVGRDRSTLLVAVNATPSEPLHLSPSVVMAVDDASPAKPLHSSPSVVMAVNASPPGIVGSPTSDLCSPPAPYAVASTLVVTTAVLIFVCKRLLLRKAAEGANDRKAKVPRSAVLDHAKFLCMVLVGMGHLQEANSAMPAGAVPNAAIWLWSWFMMPLFTLCAHVPGTPFPPACLLSKSGASPRRPDPQHLQSPCTRSSF